MPPRNDYPTPKLRWHNGAWQILWRWNNKQYSVSSGFKRQKEERQFADVVLRLFGVALANENPIGAFPEEYGASAGVLRYLEDRKFSAKSFDANENWLEAYARTLAGTIGRGWTKHTLRHLRRLDAFADGLDKVSPDTAQEYLNAVLAGTDGKRPGRQLRPKSAITHNKVLSSCMKFFNWAVRTERMKKNPFEGIKRLRKEASNDIVYCTKAQRREVIKLARETGWPDWMTIPIAFYAGMRREEIARMKWVDVRFEEGLISISKSKTGRSRETPLHKHLELMLKQIPESQRRGYVVKMPGDTGIPDKDELSRPNRMSNFIHRLREDREKYLLKQWGIKRPELFQNITPRTLSISEWKVKKQKYRDAMKQWRTAKKEHQTEIDYDLGHIGWNPFRHTFASLLVQAGVEIDTVATWMGNTPEVCRRHYAQFVPRDRRDNRINQI